MICITTKTVCFVLYHPRNSIETPFSKVMFVVYCDQPFAGRNTQQMLMSASSGLLNCNVQVGKTFVIFYTIQR